MSTQTHIKRSIVLLTGSIAMEVSLLAGIFNINSSLYHLIHVLLIAALVGSQLSLYFFWKKYDIKQNYALLFAIGTALTGVGDYVNSAISHVQPVSLKLTWAMLLFGSGYAIYNYTLWTYNNTILKQKQDGFSRNRYMVAVPFLLVNVISWYLHVEANVKGLDLLYYGSFVFNATIYVMMPMAAFWFFINTRQSTGGLIVFVGALLIPYSDLVLFGSWLRGGNPPEPSFQFYSYNWILYYGGQILISMFPGLVIDPPGEKADLQR